MSEEKSEVRSQAQNDWQKGKTPNSSTESSAVNAISWTKFLHQSKEKGRAPPSEMANGGRHSPQHKPRRLFVSAILSLISILISPVLSTDAMWNVITDATGTGL